jgi:hypothetical protein
MTGQILYEVMMDVALRQNTPSYIARFPSHFGRYSHGLGTQRRHGSHGSQIRIQNIKNQESRTFSMVKEGQKSNFDLSYLVVRVPFETFLLVHEFPKTDVTDQGKAVLSGGSELICTLSAHSSSVR